MERRPNFAWQDRTPKDLMGAVEHLREQYDDASWNINQVTQRLCYAGLHSSEVIKNVGEYQHAFELMKPIAGRAVVKSFETRMSQGTPPAVFSAFYDVRTQVLRKQVAFMFQELLAMADVQRELISELPPIWASAQVQTLIDQEVWKTPLWIKEVCDVQQYDPNDHGTEEAYQWNSWRAPRFMVMKPSRYAAFESERAWDRQDQSTTFRWLNLFTREVLLRLEKVLNDAAGEAQLAILKRAPLGQRTPSQTSSTPMPPAARDAHPSEDEEAKFGLAADYRSIQYRGKTYGLTPRQATLLELLHKAALSNYPDVSKDRLLTAVEAETSEVRNIFRDSPIWQRLVIKGDRRSAYRLDLSKIAANYP